MDKNGYQATVLYVICHMALIFFLYPSDLFSAMDMGHWIGISISYALHAIALYMYVKGLQWTAHRNVVDMFGSVSRFLPRLLLLPAFLYFGVAIIITIRAYSEMLTLVFLSNTPLWAIQLLLIHCFPHGLARNGQHGPNQCPAGYPVYNPHHFCALL